MGPCCYWARVMEGWHARPGFAFRVRVATRFPRLLPSLYAGSPFVEAHPQRELSRFRAATRPGRRGHDCRVRVRPMRQPLFRVAFRSSCCAPAHRCTSMRGAHGGFPAVRGVGGCLARVAYAVQRSDAVSTACVRSSRPVTVEWPAPPCDPSHLRTTRWVPPDWSSNQCSAGGGSPCWSRAQPSSGCASGMGVGAGRCLDGSFSFDFRMLHSQMAVRDMRSRARSREDLRPALVAW